MAIDFLTGSWDHQYKTGNNYYLYKQPNGKWRYLSFDFDNDIGVYNYQIDDRVNSGNLSVIDVFPIISFTDWLIYPHIIEILILNDFTRFEAILKEIVAKAFNPAILYPHIDELKAFIKPYVTMDKTLNENDKYPGRIKDSGSEFYYAMLHWDANSEFTSVANENYYSKMYYGIKYWILFKYRAVCTHYSMDCDPVYMDKDYQYSVIGKAQTNPMIPRDLLYNHPVYQCWAEMIGYSCCSSTKWTTVDYQDEYGDWSYDYDYNNWCGLSPPPTPECLAETLGYSCCSSEWTTVHYQDEHGDWSFDFDHNEWCGLTPFEEKEEDTCWSEKFGYPCCQGCKIEDTDNDGSWGIENDEWCGILTSQCTK